MSREIRLRNAEVHLTETMDQHLKVAEAFLGNEKKFIVEVAERLSILLMAKKKILVAGNGGSAGDAQHFAAELTGRFLKERRPLAAVSLTTDTSALTAIANDYGYQHVFVRQLEALAKKGDMFFAISTSGNSENLVLAAKRAKELGLVVVALTGKNLKCKLAEFATFHLRVPSDHTARIQEMHIWAIHEIVDLCERIFLD